MRLPWVADKDNESVMVQSDRLSGRLSFLIKGVVNLDLVWRLSLCCETNYGGTSSLPQIKGLFSWEDYAPTLSETHFGVAFFLTVSTKDDFISVAQEG